MKVGYIQLILFVGMIGSVISVLSIQIDLSPQTMAKFSRASQSAIQAAVQDIEVEPIFKKIDASVTTERAARYGGFLALMLAIPYGTRLVWNVLEKSLLNTNQTDEFFSPGGAIRYGSIAALMLALPYSSRFIWDTLKKNLFTSKATTTIDNQAQPQ